MKQLIVSIAFILALTFNINAGVIDLDSYLNSYPDRDHIVLKKEIKISYFYNEELDKYQAKSKHKVSILSLVDNAQSISLIQVPFSEYSKVKLISARYYKLSEGEKSLIENVKVKFAQERDYYINGIFYSDLKVKQFAPSVDIDKGTILDYSYEVIYKDLKFLTSFYSQTSQTEVVENFKIELNTPKSVNAFLAPFNIDRAIVEKDSIGAEPTRVIYKADIINIANVSSYPPPPAYTIPHFVVVTKSLKKGKSFVNYLSNVNDLYGWYHELLTMIKNDEALINKIKNEIVNDSDNDEEKIKKIFSWVQSNVTYIAFEDGLAGFKPENAQTVYRSRYGDCKGMANLLVQLLNASGLDAHHAWIGTRRLPYSYNLPSLVVDNHMICAVKYNSSWLYLDATSKTVNWNQPTSGIQGKEVLIDNNGSPLINKVPILDHKTNTTFLNLNLNLSDLYSIPTTGNYSCSGYKAQRLESLIMNRIISNKNKLYANRVSNIVSGFIPAQKSFNSLSDSSFSFEGQLSGVLTKVGDDIYFNSAFLSHALFGYEEDSVTSSIYFNNYNQLKLHISIGAKNGVKAKKLPQNIKKEYLNGKIIFEHSYTVIDNSIHLDINLITKVLLIKKENTDVWRQLIKDIRTSINNPIIIEL